MLHIVEEIYLELKHNVRNDNADYHRQNENNSIDKKNLLQLLYFKK